MRNLLNSRRLIILKSTLHLFVLAIALNVGIAQFATDAFAQANNGNNGNNNPGNGNGNGNGGGGNGNNGQGPNDPSFMGKLGWYKKFGAGYFPGRIGAGNPWWGGGSPNGGGWGPGGRFGDAGGTQPPSGPTDPGTVDPGTENPGTVDPGTDGPGTVDPKNPGGPGDPQGPIDGNFGTPPSEVELAESPLVRQVACLVEEDKDGKKFCREAETRKYRRKLITVNFGTKSSAE